MAVRRRGDKNANQQLLEQYILSQSLCWRHELFLFDEEVVNNVICVLNVVKGDIYNIFEAEAQELASI